MGFGGVIKLEGENEYRQALKRITTGLKEMDSEMKLVNSTVSKNDKSLSTLSQKNDILTRKLAAQNSKLAEAKTMLGQAETAYSKADKSVKEMADALDQAEKELDQAKSSGKATAEEIARLEANVSKAKTNLDNANKTYNEADTTLKKWKTTVNSAEAEVNKTSQAIVKNANEMDKASKKVKEQDSAYSQLKTTINSQESELKKLSTQYASVVLEQGKNSTEAKELKAKMNSLNSELSENKSKLNEAENEARQYSSALNDTDNAANDAKEGIGAMGVALGSLISQMAMRAVDKLKELATSTIEVGMSFDSAMSKVQAVSGATGKEYDTLKEKALQMGSSTKFTASEAAEAFNYMAMAGWKTGDMLDGIEPILNLAAAAGADLATTSDIVTDALTAMGYSAKDAGRLTDVMAAASSNANTNVELMGETFKYVAPVSGALGYSMEDLALGIGLMANAGIKGEQAGTSLRSVLTRLASPPKDAADAMNELGISITNTDGTMKPLNQIIIELKKSFAGLNEQQKAQMANSIAGKNAMSGFLALVNGSDADFNKLSTAINNSSGAAEKMAKTMNDNLGGDLISLKSKFEGVQIQLYKGLEPALRQGAQSLKKFLETKDWESFGRSVGEVLNKVVSGLQFLINHAGAVTTAIGAMLAAFAVSKINDFTQALGVTIAKLIATATATTAETGAVTAATVAQNLWNAALTANPIGIVVMAVAALAAGVIALTKVVDENTKAEQEAAIARKKAADDTLSAMQEEANAYTELKTRIEEKASADMANIANAQRLKDELMGLADANGVVAEGDRVRAEFILGQLNQALGTEYTMTGNQIANYQQLQSEVAKTIEAKKAEILFAAQEEAYANAIQNRSQAEQNATQLSQELVAQEQVVAEAKKKLTEESDAMAAGSDAMAQAFHQKRIDELSEILLTEQQTLQEKQEAYNKNEETLRGYYNDIGSYETASQQLLEGKTNEAINTLDRKNNAFMTAADVVGKSADEQKFILAKQVQDTELNAKLMEQRYKDGVSGVTKEMVETARKQADQAKTEFEKVGGNLTEGISQGADAKKGSLWDKMSSIIDGALAAAKRAATIKSPSRKFRDIIGKNISLGIAVGIQDKANVVNKSITELTDDVINTAEKSIESIKEETDSYIKLKESIENKAKADRANLDNTKRLATELKSLANANGEVAEGDKTRAEFILGQLNKALGTEYTMTGNQISNYQQLQSEVAKTIEVKKAEILLKAQEEAYTNAIQNRMEAEKNAAKLSQELLEKQSKVNSYRRLEAEALHYVEIARNQELKNMYAERATQLNTLATAEETALQKIQEAYNLNENTLRQYYQDINIYETASQQLLEGKTADAINTLHKVDEAFVNATDVADKSAEEQKKILAQQLVDTKINAELMAKRYKEGVSGVSKEMVETARQQAEKAEIEFKKVGENVTVGIAEGAQNKQNFLWQTINNIISGALAAAKAAASIQSPSKKFRDLIGKNISLGIADGIRKETKAVTQAITDLTGEMLKSADKSLPEMDNIFNPSISSNLSNIALSGGDKQAELVLGLDKLNSLTNKLNNIDRDDSSKYNKLVKAFESALSNMTVELDDEVAGKFVEKTVARAIYT